MRYVILVDYQLNFEGRLFAVAVMFLVFHLIPISDDFLKAIYALFAYSPSHAR
jgi:hypothetical protein